MRLYGTKAAARGFTLIELLVVIAIIGMLSSVVLASLNSARAKARDAQRKSDLKQLQLALELYYQDNGRYPAGCTTATWTYSTSCPSNYITGLVPNYISVLPRAPGGNNSQNYILYSARSGDSYQSYKLMERSPETEIITSSSAWARCSNSCTSGWCSTHTADQYNTPYYSVSNGGVAQCAY